MKFRFLTNNFYDDYSHCVEMERKKDRPYALVCIIKYGNFLFAIPIRHNINHPYKISTIGNQGLDLTKAVIIDLINSEKYIENYTAFINKLEFEILEKKEKFIIKKMENYIKIYKKALKNQQIKRNEILCKMSCLQYFHNELGI